MTRRRFRGATAALLCLTVAGAMRPYGDPLTLGVGSKLSFDGKSTVRDWSCTATQMDAVIDAEAAAVGNVLKAQKAVRTATLTFPVAKLDCANGTMNNHMLKALNATKHEAIVFTLTGYEFIAGAPLKGTMSGTLTINGVTKPITLPAEFAASGAALKVNGSYALTMTEWQVQPPKLMMGTLKVNPVVNVRFELLLQP